MGELMNNEELKSILIKHALWLAGDESGERANLQGAYLQGAYLRGADLRGAYLQGADLQDAYLRGANLQDADLRGAYLQGADLQDAYLRGANLQDAYLQDAYLRDACLRDADLYNALGNGKQIKTIQSGKYVINYTADRIQIGCESHLIEEWFNFSDLQISEMDHGALEWWRVWKPLLQQIIEASPAEK